MEHAPSVKDQPRKSSNREVSNRSNDFIAARKELRMVVSEELLPRLDGDHAHDDFGFDEENDHVVNCINNAVAKDMCIELPQHLIPINIPLQMWKFLRAAGMPDWVEEFSAEEVSCNEAHSIF